MRQCKTFVTNVSAAPGYGWSPPLIALGGFGGIQVSSANAVCGVNLVIDNFVYVASGTSPL